MQNERKEGDFQQQHNLSFPICSRIGAQTRRYCPVRSGLVLIFLFQKTEISLQPKTSWLQKSPCLSKRSKMESSEGEVSSPKIHVNDSTYQNFLSPEGQPLPKILGTHPPDHRVQLSLAATISSPARIK